jgi:hypothetical protein
MNIFFETSRQDMWPTKPTIQCVARALSPGAKRPAHEDDLSLPLSAEVKNG